MRSIASWKIISIIVAGLFVADFASGFLAPDLPFNLPLSLLLSTLVFAISAARQSDRAFLRAGLGLLFYFCLSQLLTLLLPVWLSTGPALVAALHWSVTLAALIAGTLAGRAMAIRKRADA